MKKKALAFAAAACALGMLLSGCGASNDAASDGGKIGRASCRERVFRAV